MSTVAAACDGPTDPPDTGPDIIVTTSVESYVLWVGAGTTFSATVQNHRHTSAIIWRSESPQIAVVTTGGSGGGVPDGTVVGVAPGITRVTAISVEDTTKRAHIEITVTHPGGVAGLIVAPAGADLGVGGTTQLTALLAGVPATVTWRSSDPTIASVSTAGVVTGVAAGEAVVVALLSTDTARRATALIRVGAAAPAVLPLLGHGIVAERYTGEVAARGEWAYTSTWGNRGAPGNVVKVWNVAGNTPILRDSLVVPGASTTGDVQISDDGALLVVAVEHNPNGAIMIYDRTNPARPDSIRRFSSPQTQQGVHTVKLGRVDGRHYAFLSVNPGTQPATLVIVDITDPRNPVQVFFQAMGQPFVHDVFVRDGVLFTALWNQGLRIYDIGGGASIGAARGGTPSNPVVIGEIPTISGRIHNVWWFHDPTNNGKRYVFLGEEGPGSIPVRASGDLHVIDITNPAQPVQVAQYGVPNAGAHNFWMDEPRGILYAAFYNGGVRALDARGDLGSCTAAQRNTRGFCDLWKMGRELAIGVPPGAFVWGVVYDNGFVYASDMAAGIYKFAGVVR